MMCVYVYFINNVKHSRFRCVTTSNMSTTSDVNVEIPINRSGSVEVAMLPNGFRYAVS